MKEKFKVGDKVYCVISGHGVIKNICDSGIYRIEVFFNNKNENYYTLDGRLYDYSNPTLSIREYTLKGFTKERPIESGEEVEGCYIIENINLQIK